MNINGYKTYIIGIAMICYAAGGFVAGKVDGSAALEALMMGLGLMGLRHGIEKGKLTP